MSDKELIVNTKLELREIVNRCYYEFDKKGFYSEEKENNYYNRDRFRVKAFESIIATGLYHIIKENEIKTDFNYLGNNNNISLLLDDATLRQLLREKDQ